MRFFCIGSIVCVLCMSANPVEAITYNSVSNESSHIHQIPQNELYEAKVLLTYIETYRDKIRNIAQSLDVENTPFMHDIFTTLSKMQEALIYIGQGKVHPHDATPVMQSIVNDLKSINNRLQIYLKQTRQKKQQELEIIREKYEIIGVQISQILTQIIYQISQPLTSKESLTQKEQKIVQTLNKLQQENAKIRKFSHISFNSKEDIQSYFKKIITNIRREIQTLKELL